MPKHVALVSAQYSLHDKPSSMVGIQEMEAEALLAAGKEDELIERVWTAYQDYRQDKGFVVIEGSSMDVLGGDLYLHGRIASELGAPVLFTVDFRRDEIVSAEEAANRALIGRQELQGVGVHDDQILGVILNKVPMKNHAMLSSEVPKRLQKDGLRCLGVVPWDPVIGSARLNEVATALEAWQVAGSDLDSGIHDIVIAGQSAGGVLEDLDRLCHRATSDESLMKEIDGTLKTHGNKPSMAEFSAQAAVPAGRCALVLATSDRSDVALSLAAAHVSGAGPTVAGLLLCDASNARLPYVGCSTQLAQDIRLFVHCTGVLAFF